MEIRRSCKTCKTSFSAIKTTQLFCSRRCFKRDYYVRTRIRIKEAALNPVFPKIKCGFCNTLISLNFDPLKSPGLFDSWECPNCGVSNQMIWRHQNQPNSYQVVKSLVMTTSLYAGNYPMPQVEPTILTCSSGHPINEAQAPAMVIISSTAIVSTKATPASA